MTETIDYDKKLDDAHRIYNANQWTSESIAWMVTYNNFGTGFEGNEEADRMHKAIVDAVRMTRGEIEIR